MDSDDKRNVDEQLDEEQRRSDERQAHPLIENHTNNTRTTAEEETAIGNATGAIVGTTVTNPSADQNTTS